MPEILPKDVVAMETGIYGWRARLGYAGPSPISNIPYEFWRMAPDGVAMVSTGLHVSREFDGGPEEAAREASDAIRALDPFGLDSIAISLAPLVYARGGAALKDIRNKVSAIGSAPVFFDIEAVVEAAGYLKANRLTVLSPYSPAINRGMASYFKEAGLQIAEVISHPLGSSPTNGGHLRKSIAEAVAKAQPDGLYIAGDAWIVAKDIAGIERRLHVPVITEPQALLWLLLRRLQIHAPQLNCGRLLANA